MTMFGVLELNTPHNHSMFSMSFCKERQEAKQRGETAKDDGPRLSKKDLEMAEKVSKYNVSVWVFFFNVYYTPHSQSHPRPLGLLSKLQATP